MIRQLEKIKINNIEYFRDDRLKEFRQVMNPHVRFDFEEVCRCNNCMNYWHDDDLTLGEDEEGFLKGCPNCKTDGYLMDAIYI